MRFDDLPDNWTTLALDDGPLAAGVIDLLLGHHDRMRDTLLILPCDHHDVGLPSPILIGETRWDLPARDRREAMTLLPQLPAPGFVMGVSSARPLADRVVRGWLRTIEDELDASGQALLAFGVADLGAVDIVGGRAVRNGSLGGMAV